ncbi:DUF1345 domain-containing protein [Candidatus Synechococcus calcipolaris G9]|uniref:DUF1345 domain-containing protein n=1 Tax=Candidatus Synechococcus calcipolaris G9 TaxID=1497997 RepID=A0ABT6EUZ4_9SYNE|nr:DUF1345 domain-containing protein [Candidatus Synechococcus calcipolaris]MDG2989652.1 DUF1345 domain-containing protein [Candidatus Synechococcus calcipolaris G9]
MNRLWRSLDHIHTEIRIVLALVVAALTLVLTAHTYPLAIRLMLAWDFGVTAYLLLLLKMMLSLNGQQTRVRSQRGEPNALFIMILVVFTAIASIIATGLILADSKNGSNPLLTFQVSLATWAVLAAWSLTHTSFGLQYARYYYDDNHHRLNDAGYAGGLDFPMEEEPDYLDFMYFSFTISLTSQTSDVSIVAQRIRRLVLFHELVSFFFYSVIVGLVINVIAGLW